VARISEEGGKMKEVILIEQVAKRLYYICHPNKRSRLTWKKYGLKRRYFDEAKKLIRLIRVK
jgi:hypothetical protein